MFSRVPRSPGPVNGPRRDFPVRSPIVRFPGSFNLITFLCYYFSFVFLVFSFLVFHYFMSPYSYQSVVLGILAVRTTLVTGAVERTTELRGVTILPPLNKFCLEILPSISL